MTLNWTLTHCLITMEQLHAKAEFKSIQGCTNIYNGPGSHIYDAYKHRKGIGQKLLRFPNSKLKILSESIEPTTKIARR